MSGTFNEIDVPPTLVSFAVDVAKIQDVITPELKKAGNKLVWLQRTERSVRSAGLCRNHGSVRKTSR